MDPQVLFIQRLTVVDHLLTPNTLTSSDEMVIQAGAVITVEGNVTLNAIKLTVYGTLFIHTPAIAG